MGLDLKYRPLVFKDVLGQESAVKILKKQLAENDVGTAYLFSGPYGSGKTTIARILARSILCQDRLMDGEPCNQCENCNLFLKDQNFYFTEIDGASHGKVEDIRKIKEDAEILPAKGLKKVLLIDECHAISKSANQALLKQLEEGSESMVYLFCTTEPKKLLETVRSRCQEFGIRMIPFEKIIKRLEFVCKEEGVVCEKEALELIVKESLGHVRDALKSLDRIRILGDVTVDLVLEHLNVDLYSEYAKILLNLKENPRRSLDILETVFSRVDPREAYDGLLQVALAAYKLTLKVKSDLPVRENLLEALCEKYKGKMLKIVSFMVERERRVERVVLSCDLMVLNSFLNNGFVEKSGFTGFQKAYVDVPVPPLTSVDVELKKKKEKSLSPKRRNMNGAVDSNDNSNSRRDMYKILSPEDFRKELKKLISRR